MDEEGRPRLSSALVLLVKGEILRHDLLPSNGSHGMSFQRLQGAVFTQLRLHAVDIDDRLVLHALWSEGDACSAPQRNANLVLNLCDVGGEWAAACASRSAAQQAAVLQSVQRRVLWRLIMPLRCPALLPAAAWRHITSFLQEQEAQSLALVSSSVWSTLCSAV